VIVEGSCLCGTVGFEARLPSARFVNCHCSRCRKATGSTSAANAVVRPDAFRLTRDVEEVARFDLPTARELRHRVLPRLRVADAAPHPERPRSDCALRRARRRPAGAALGARPLGSHAPWMDDAGALTTSD
jgi:Glutathione-dependent formaldehyde-activating enzyme